MQIQEIKELIQALEQSSLTSLEWTSGAESIRLEKAVAAQAAVTVPMVQAPVAAAPVAPVVTPQEVVAQSSTIIEGEAVTCPLVGVFYAAPSPEDAPFVTVGSTVKKGDVLCIVEAMKLMNEITAEKDGVITQVCVENGEVVEFGQSLFYLA